MIIQLNGDSALFCTRAHSRIRSAPPSTLRGMASALQCNDCATILLIKTVAKRAQLNIFSSR